MIKSDKVKEVFICDGEQSVFEFSFRMFNDAIVKVFLDEEEQLNGFELSFYPNKIGGKVRFFAPPFIGKKLTIIRQLQFSRNFDFQTGGVFRAEDLNYELDFNIACLNQLQYDCDKSLKLCDTDSGVSPVLPEAKAGHALVWNEEENALVNTNISIDEQIKYAEDCVNTVETLYDDLTDIMQGNMNMGIIGLFNNLKSVILANYPKAITDYQYVNNNADQSSDYGNIVDLENVDLIDNGSV